MKADYEIDSGRLIQLVKEQPALWDRNHHSYKDRDKTKEAWISICRDLRDEFMDMDDLEINQITKQLKKKWGNIRDQWLKCYRKLEDEKKYGSGSSRTKRYVFQDQLHFLESSYRFNVTDQGNANDEVSQDDDEMGGYEEPAIVYLNSPDSEDHEAINEQARSLKRRLLSEPRISTTGEHSEDRHLMFFKGIVPSLRSFSEEETMDFQLGVLQLIRAIKHQRTTQSRQSHYKSLFPYNHLIPYSQPETNADNTPKNQPSQSNDSMNDTIEDCNF